jgi:hypothetical protein
MIMISFAMNSMYARSKQSITIKNEYGTPVYVNVEFRSKVGLNMHSSKRRLLEKNQTMTVKANNVNDTLYKIYTAPLAAVNPGAQIGAIGVGAGYGVGVGGAAAMAVAGASTASAALAATGVGAAVMVGGIAAGAATAEILKSLNNASRKAHGNKFFVISHNSKESKLPKTKQIVITGYPSEAHYQTTKNTLPVAQPQESESKETSTQETK